MKKLLLVMCTVSLVVACTIRKEGGTWAVKKTIVDEVKESIQDTKELVTDVSDANEDLSNKRNVQPSPGEAGQATSTPVASENTPKVEVEKEEVVTQEKYPPKPKSSKKNKKSKR
jgi:hypothetical protein